MTVKGGNIMTSHDASSRTNRKRQYCDVTPQTQFISILSILPNSRILNIGTEFVVCTHFIFALCILALVHTSSHKLITKQGPYSFHHNDRQNKHLPPLH
ncbi:hypothetical protein BO85DRAFT_222034 [Aspergillus piperis CBS 112811]|uniref:Uncharacterized protein n=1 Tax=Aspergillus piperis CBS 112811 TaxID=1448313 RepID=A0A8G1RBI2_9EURO|nr:hypothetical protein BO85DRAFT_222034 [Aspergillus piperis CBS 112811]RAH60250.1 hypothetical protein BO85DRAFT_222034 [Aspergillus piperis CBS 112811]